MLTHGCLSRTRYHIHCGRTISSGTLYLSLFLIHQFSHFGQLASLASLERMKLHSWNSLYMTHMLPMQCLKVCILSHHTVVQRGQILLRFRELPCRQRVGTVATFSILAFPSLVMAFLHCVSFNVFLKRSTRPSICGC